MTLEIPGVQNPTTAFAKKLGWTAWRMQILGRRGCPDSWFFKRGCLLIIEFKAPGKEPNEQQLRRHRDLREAGFEVYVIDNLADGIDLIKRAELGLAGTFVVGLPL